MQHEVVIARAPEHVLAYASTPTSWPEWHPSSLRVDGPKGPLVAGSGFDEDIRAGGREGHLRWSVVESVPGRRWVARATGDRHGLSLTLTYECSPTVGGTRFVRTLDYGFSSVAMRVVDRLVLRRRIDRESTESLAILRRVIESTDGPSSARIRP